jgi:hypothetical protein
VIVGGGGGGRGWERGRRVVWVDVGCWGESESFLLSRWLGVKGERGDAPMVERA